MMVVFCIFSAFPRIVVVIVVAIEFEDTIDIVSITMSIPPKIAMYHSACIRFCTCTHQNTISVVFSNFLSCFYFITIDNPSMTIPNLYTGNRINNYGTAIIYHGSHPVIIIVESLYIVKPHVF